MAGTYVHEETDGNTIISTEYSCSQKGMQYTVIGDNIKSDFDFLLSSGDIVQNLNLMLNELKTAAGNVNAFYFENGDSVKNIEHVYSQIEDEVEKITVQLQTLHDALIKDIDNVNAELEVNFGHWIGYKVEAGRTTKTTVTTDNNG